MSISRRRFLKAGAVVSAALVLKPGTFALGRNSQWSNAPGSNAAYLYRRELFEPYVGDIFRVRVGKQMIDLKLVALENVSPASRGITTGKVVRTDCFSMRFHARTPLPMTARIHNLNHSKLGSFDLFMSQSQEGGKFLQTAIVNHVS
jgi:uncharacterized protein DUF6916/TAT (twin-arginine translocation) pathway-exported protein